MQSEKKSDRGPQTGISEFGSKKENERTRGNIGDFMKWKCGMKREYGSCNCRQALAFVIMNKEFSV